MKQGAIIITTHNTLQRWMRLGLGMVVLSIMVGFSTSNLSSAAPVPTDFPSMPSLTATSTIEIAIPTLTPTITPTPTFSSTPTLNPRASAQEVVAELQAGGVVPSGGWQLFGVPNGYALTSDPGYSFLPLGKGQTSRDFVLGFQMGWHWIGPESACGIRFRGQSTDWRSVMLTADGHLMLTHLIGGNLMVNYDQVAVHFAVKSLRNPILLIAIGNTFTVYLDGQLEAMVTDDTVATDTVTSGGFAFEVYNPANNTIVTSCAYYNLWVWSFNGTPTATSTS